MSMSINALDYLNGLYPNTRTTSSEKSNQSTSEAGKTQQSTVSASLDQANLGEDGITVTEVSRLQGTEQSGAQKQSAAPRMDTVEISEEGRAASAKMQTQQTDTAEDDLPETEDWSEYTDSELKQMYYKGEITRQEYEKATGETLE